MQPVAFEGKVCFLNGICPVASAQMSLAPQSNLKLEKLVKEFGFFHKYTLQTQVKCKTVRGWATDTSVSRCYIIYDWNVQKTQNEDIAEVQVITTKGVGVMSEKRWTGTPRLMNTAAARLAKRLLLPPLGGWARAS